MSDSNLLAQQFESNRALLRGVAYRMLGSMSEAEDAVQESWIRLSRTETGQVENLSGWLTTVVSRVCLDMLRSRKSKREDPLEWPMAESINAMGSGLDPAEEAVLAESVGPALLVVLETLSPAERLAFVLHDVFAVPFEEIAATLNRSPAATRQLASRARRRVQGANDHSDTDPLRKRELVEAFLAASRGGHFDALVALLDPNAMVRADATAVGFGADGTIHGAHGVAGMFSGRAQVAKLALVDGNPGAVWAPGGKPRVVFAFTIQGAKITAIELLSDPERLRALDLVFLHAS